MKHKHVKSKLGTTHYWIYKNPDKNARCIVFTHGLTANHTMFEKQVEYFSKEYTVITWDVPLHGESRSYNNFSYKNTALELKSILDSENLEQVILVGMSMGGYPCQEFATLYPQNVAAFVALGTTPLGLCYYSFIDRWLLRRVKTISKLFPDKMLRTIMAKSVSRTKYAYNMMIKMLEPLSKSEIVEQIGIAYARVFDRKESIHFDFPVLILLGEYDKTGKIKRYCEAWSKKEAYPLHIIKDAAHFANADNYDDVNKEIHGFITQLKI